MVRCDYVTVKTNSGPVVGYCESGYCSFKGIPYAESTAGNNRWLPPIPKATWTEPLLAQTFSPQCPQPTSGATSEDCLYLNIWVPSYVFDGSFSGTLPTFFWIHGGSFIIGTGSDPTFYGDYLANSTGIIVVTINYRLGPLGFLNTPILQGNYGILDQQLALIWVTENIDNFGGDGKRVTVGGQSAGAMSTTLHLLITNSSNLIYSAIIESNPAGILYRTPDQNIPYAERFANHVNCSYMDMECLRSVPVSEIEKVTRIPEYIITIPLKSTEFLPWMPVIDGTMIRDQPINMIENGYLKNCPILIGTVMNETNGFVVDIPIGNYGYNEILKIIFSENATAVEEVYPDDHRDSIKELQMLTTDYYFLCPSRRIAQVSGDHGNLVFGYQFTQKPSDDYMSTNPLCAQGPCHSAELPFVFHSQYFHANASWTLEETQLSFDIMNYWSSFLFTSDLSLSNGTGNPAWPLFNSASNITMLLNMPLTSTTNYRSYYCDFWDSMGYIY